VRKSVRVVREAATQAGRDPAAIEIAARLFVCVDPLTQEADLGVRRYINAYLNVPVYQAFQEWLGRAALLTPMWQAWSSGDRRGAVAAVPEQVVNDLIIRGSTAEIRAHVLRYLEADVDTAFLQLLTFEPDAARRREVLLEAMRTLAPAPFEQ
jgi:alkanesulfonate monooxygenase SsuD/methylene tetrahydromethanopterin reductase-like flavin-dependent oxidoreductase (luciferase family)